MIWAAAGMPKEEMFHNKTYVEFHANPDWDRDIDIGSAFRGQDVAEHTAHLESHQSHVTMRGDVPPSQILGIHHPWHAYVRHIESDPRMLHDYTQGDFKDTSIGDPEADKAVAHVRAKHARGMYGLGPGMGRS
jgi:hypothetical protein